MSTDQVQKSRQHFPPTMTRPINCKKPCLGTEKLYDSQVNNRLAIIYTENESFARECALRSENGTSSRNDVSLAQLGNGETSSYLECRDFSVL